MMEVMYELVTPSQNIRLDDGDGVNRCMSMEIKGVSEKMWWKCVKDEMKSFGPVL